MGQTSRDEHSAIQKRTPVDGLEDNSQLDGNRHETVLPLYLCSINMAEIQNPKCQFELYSTQPNDIQIEW